MTDETPLQIEIPNGSDWESTIRFPALIAALESVRQVHFNFSNVAFVSPGWTMVIARALKSFRESRPGTLCKVVGANTRGMRYAGHAGFFDALGIPWDNAMGEAAATSTFVPLTERSVISLFEAQPIWRRTGEIIQDYADELAAILAQGRHSILYETLSYAIREIIRNIAEHSKSPSFRFSAQCWPASGMAEIAIEDSGIGIAAGLASHHKYTPADDAAALTLATQAGVSGTVLSNRINDEWANSGYGLFIAKALADGPNGFTIISGDAALLAGNGADRVLRSSLAGTCVAIRLKAGDRKLEDRLSSIIAKTGGEPSRASVSGRVTRKRGGP